MKERKITVKFIRGKYSVQLKKLLADCAEVIMNLLTVATVLI